MDKLKALKRFRFLDFTLKSLFKFDVASQSTTFANRFLKLSRRRHVGAKGRAHPSSRRQSEAASSEGETDRAAR